MLDLLQRGWAWLKALPADVFYRVILWILTSVVLLPNITFGMFCLYMAEHDFFSYDFFNEGDVGMNMFFLVTTGMLVLFASAMWSPIFLMAGWRRIKTKTERIIYSILTVFFVLYVWAIFLIGFYNAGGVNSEDYDFLLVLLLLTFSLALHITSLIFFAARVSVATMGILICLLFFLSVSQQTGVSKLIGMGLKTFGVGGGVPITINLNSTETIEGKLALISPQFVYVTESDKGANLTIPFNSIEYYQLGKPNTKAVDGESVEEESASSTTTQSSQSASQLQSK